MRPVRALDLVRASGGIAFRVATAFLFVGLRRDRFSRAGLPGQAQDPGGRRRTEGGCVNSELPSLQLTCEEGGDRSLDRTPREAVATQVDNLRAYRQRRLSRLEQEN